MATDYALNLKATLDTSEVLQKLQALGQTGTAATSNLENAVKSLDLSIKQLADSWKTTAHEQEKSTAAMSSQLTMLKRFAKYAIAHELGGSLTSQGQAAASQGNDRAAAAYGFGGGAIKGGMMMAMATLNPIAIAGAAVIGGVTDALENLAKSAQVAADAMAEAARQQQLSIKKFHDAENTTALEQEKRAMRDLSQEQLKEYNAKAAAASRKYEEFTTRGSAAQREFASRYKGDDFVKARDEELKRLQEQKQQTLDLADAAQAELDRRSKEAKDIEAEKQRKEKEAADLAARAQERGELFARKRSLEIFLNSLPNMSVGELQDITTSLSTRKEDLADKIQKAYSDKDLATGLKAEEEYTDVNTRLKAALSALGNLLDLGSSKETDTPLQSLLSTPTSTEASKGYDVGGYAKLEDAIWRAQLDVQKQIDSNTMNSAERLKQLVEKVELIQQNVADNNIGTNWGD